MSTTSPPPTRWATRLAIAYFCFATALLIWPLYSWLANSIEPRVLGLPWSLAWILGVIAANFLVLLLLYQLRLIDDREHEAHPGPLEGA